MTSAPENSPSAAAAWDELAARLNHRFSEPRLLVEALTHPSAANQGGAGEESYERLEFLGDRVLGLVVADLLLVRFPDEEEGALSKRLAELVRRETLAEVARSLGLERHLRLAKGEERSGERDNPALLADACEAVIGALYIDGGLEPARAFVEAHWIPYLEAASEPPSEPKTALQEWAQGRGLPLPKYREVARSGPDHEPLFTIEVRVEGQPPARGEGRSKRLAEQGAAERLLDSLTGAA
ncbi:MAG: ribonuclease III [Kiloniellales bacterium]